MTAMTTSLFASGTRQSLLTTLDGVYQHGTGRRVLIFYFNGVQGKSVRENGGVRTMDPFRGLDIVHSFQYMYRLLGNYGFRCSFYRSIDDPSSRYKPGTAER